MGMEAYGRAPDTGIKKAIVRKPGERHEVKSEIQWHIVVQNRERERA